MFLRIFAIAMNAYREAVRARVLYGLLALALATCGYSMVVATLSLHQEPRVVADLGAASISLYGVLVAIVLGATSLHRELELKTIFPILSRPLRRHEYLLGKYFGLLGTLLVFIALDAGTILIILGIETHQAAWKLGATVGTLAASLTLLLVFAKRSRVFVLIPWSLAFFVAAFFLASTAGEERGLVTASAALSLAEVGIVAAVAMLFSSFSTPFMTAIFTLLVFLVGRSSDTLENLPPRVFGQGIHNAGAVLAKIFPNLHAYVPPRPLLLGKVAAEPIGAYVALASAHAIAYAAILLCLGAIIFRKRDFQ